MLRCITCLVVEATVRELVAVEALKSVGCALQAATRTCGQGQVCTVQSTAARKSPQKKAGKTHVSAMACIRRRAALLLALACGLALTGGSSSAPRPSAKARAPKKAPAAEADEEPDDAPATTVVHCLAHRERGGPLEPYTYELEGELEPKEVEIEVHACGLSRADLQAASDEDTVFPMVPGREVIGHVVKAGSAVSSVRPGQRVGVGLQMGDVEGDVLVKEAPVSVGGLADRIRVRSRWAFPIPDALPTEQATPLLGAGAVSWSHLQRAKLKRGSKVGVVGLGGIGHLAVQFASRMGHTVHVIGARPASPSLARVCWAVAARRRLPSSWPRPPLPGQPTHNHGLALALGSSPPHPGPACRDPPLPPPRARPQAETPTTSAMRRRARSSARRPSWRSRTRTRASAPRAPTTCSSARSTRTSCARSASSGRTASSF